MNAITGVTTIEIGGKSRPLKFGVNQTFIYCQLRKIEFAEYTMQIQSLATIADPAVIRDLIYSALVAGSRSEKKEPDFDVYDVGDWLDTINPAELTSAFEVMMASNGPNAPAPVPAKGQN